MEKEGTYSLPIHSYSEVLYYNVDFFEKNNLTVPTTWDEMVDTCSKIREITGAPAFGWDNLAGSFMTLVKQFGGRYTDQNGNIYFANEDADVALKVLNFGRTMLTAASGAPQARICSSPAPLPMSRSPCTLATAWRPATSPVRIRI